MVVRIEAVTQCRIELLNVQECDTTEAKCIDKPSAHKNYSIDDKQNFLSSKFL